MCALQRIFCVMAVAAVVLSSPLETTPETDHKPQTVVLQAQEETSMPETSATTHPAHPAREAALDAHTHASALGRPQGPPSSPSGRRGRQPSVSEAGRVSARLARTKRGSGVVIRGPFYPYPKGRGYLRFTSGASHTQGRAPGLLLLVGITFAYSSWRRWA